MPRLANSPKVYEIAAEFRDRCLVRDLSLLWPDESVWTPQTVEEAIERYIGNPQEQAADFWEKVRAQFDGATDNCRKLLADALFFYFLVPVSVKKETKYKNILRAAEMAGARIPPLQDSRWTALEQGICRVSQLYNLRYSQLAMLILLAKSVKQSPDRRAAVDDRSRLEAALDSILSAPPNYVHSADMRHAVLHLFHPDAYEPIISTTDKKRIAEAFKDKLPSTLPETATVDDKLAAIRKYFESQPGQQGRPFHFYSPDIKPLWKPGSEHPGGGEGDGGRDEGGAGRDEGGELEQDLLLDEILRTLRRAKQVILHGPPGTGKTLYAVRVARELVSQDNFSKSWDELSQQERERLAPDAPWDGPSPSYLRMCTFHPGYSYEDFIECYRPHAAGGSGGVQFSLQDGLFKRMCRAAEGDPERSYVLIIDEINRGDIPRIFGELITLLDADKRKKPGMPVFASTVLPYSQEPFAVPNNLHLIGTMNTADRSIALLDVALRRRFEFIELLPCPEELKATVIAGLNVGDWLGEVNKRISVHLHPSLQVGHGYFMPDGKPVNGKEVFLDIVRRKILPLLHDICYDTPARLSDILGPEFFDPDAGAFAPALLRPEGDDELLRALRSVVGGG